MFEQIFALHKELYMRQLFASVALTAAALTGTAAYANNVAVADSQAALFGTAYAKQTSQSLETSVKGQKDRIAALTKEINALQSRFDKDGKLMKPEERQALQTQAQSKVNEYNSTMEGLQKRYEEMQATIVKTQYPKLEKIVEDIRKEGNYDIIIEKKNVIWVNETVDITNKIIQRLDAQK
jgi:outer membrane protein